MNYEIDVVLPVSETKKGFFLASEEEEQHLKINLDPLKKDLEDLLSMLNNLQYQEKYAVDEVSLTASAAYDEAGTHRAGISLKLFILGGESAVSAEKSFKENRILEIKIKRIT